MYLVLVLFAMFASLFTLQKETLNYAEPFFLIGSRMLFAGILLVGFEAIFRRENFKLKTAHIAPLFMLAIANIYLTNILEIWGLSKMSSAKTCLLYSISPFMAALIAFIVLKERFSPKKWIGMFIGFLGLIPILYTQSESELASGQILIFSMAELAGIGAVVFSVYGWILLKKVITEHKLTPIMANGVSMLIGGVLALGHSYLSGETWSPIPVNNFNLFASYSVITCIVSNIICYNLYGHLLKKFSATFMSFAGLITPVFATIFGYVFLKEKIDIFYFVSVSIFSVGLFVFYREEIEQKKAKELQEQPAN